MASGVDVHTDCLKMYEALKLGRKFKYIIYNLNADMTQIVVEKTSHDTDYEEFLKELPEDDCRYAVYDLEFEKEGGAGTRNKIVFLSWSPDSAKIKKKMVFASSRDALRRQLVGVAVEIQGTAHDEVAYETVLEKANRIGH